MLLGADNRETEERNQKHVEACESEHASIVSEHQSIEGQHAEHSEAS
jgi:hypothetical protein